ASGSGCHGGRGRSPWVGVTAIGALPWLTRRERRCCWLRSAFTSPSTPPSRLGSVRCAGAAVAARRRFRDDRVRLLNRSAAESVCATQAHGALDRTVGRLAVHRRAYPRASMEHSPASLPAEALAAG